MSLRAEGEAISCLSFSLLRRPAPRNDLKSFMYFPSPSQETSQRASRAPYLPLAQNTTLIELWQVVRAPFSA